MDEKKYQEEVQEESPIASYFKVLSGAEWMDEAAHMPVKRKLAGELWFEGENAVLFADSNAGKSILAVQIADAISRGEPIHPLEMTADAPSGNFTQFVCDAIESVMSRVGAKIAIIDNISYLNDELEKSKAAAPLIKQLKAIKKRNGFSFLILAHTPKRQNTKPITKNDLSGSKMIMNLVDSAFAIGDSKQEPGLHYINQVKSRNARYVYDKDNVLLGKIVKEVNFLKFEFMGTALELDHLESAEPISRERLVNLIKHEYPKGKSCRSIADQAGYSHTTVNKVVAELIRAGELEERGNDAKNEL